MSELDQRALSLDEVARRLAETGVPWAVFAGAAAAAYGVSRPINDIDILVPATEEERVAKAFPEAEIERRANGAVWVLSLPGYDILAGLRQMDMDQEMGERLRYREIEGVRVPVIPVEDNIAIKAMRGHGAAEGKRDWEDVEEMLRAAGAVDWGYLLWRLEQLEPKERVAEVQKRLEMLGATW